MSTIYLSPDQVPAWLRDNRTRQYRAIASESVTIPADAGLWSEGSRDTYALVSLANGESMATSDNMASPWDGTRRDRTVTLQRGYVVICRSIVAGKHAGLTIYARPDDLAPLLPAPSAEMSPLEETVLEYTASRKSSYNGRDRYGMYTDDLRWSATPQSPATRAQWDAAKSELIAKGLLNKAGAITVAGRNARRSPF